MLYTQQECERCLADAVLAAGNFRILLLRKHATIVTVATLRSVHAYADAMYLLRPLHRSCPSTHGCAECLGTNLLRCRLWPLRKGTDEKATASVYSRQFLLHSCVTI